MKRILISVMVLLLALGLGGGRLALAQSKVVRLTLIDENGSGEDGSAQLTDQGDGSTKVELIMLNVPEGDVQPAAIHEGTCANLDAAEVYALESVTESRSTTIVKESLADLTAEKHAITVYRSASDKTIISCGNLPTGAAAGGGSMTLDQVLSTLHDQAEEIEGQVRKQENDASLNAYDAYHTIFAAHENEIKAKNEQVWQELEDAMHGVRDAINEGNWDEAAEAAEKLVQTVEDAQKELGGAPAALTVEQSLDKLGEQANDLVRETANKDDAGSQAAYDAYHETFATNEGAIKEKNEAAWQELEDGMHEVRDAIQAKDWTKANEAAKELVIRIDEAKAAITGSTTGTTTGPTSGTMSLEQVFETLGAQAADLVRETANNDSSGSQAAYDAWHATFAANEDAIKAKNETAWQSLEDGMHEVRDAIQAGDFTKANTAAKELQTTVREAEGAVMGGAEPLPTTGNADQLLFGLLIAAFSLALMALGLVAKHVASRSR
jgi:hypothetical protein